MSSDGTRVAIGARYNDDTGYNAGHVRVFDWISRSKKILKENIVEVSGELIVSKFVGSSGTGALTLPSGTTGQQPSTGVRGMIRFNSTLNRLEVYNGTVWQSINGISATGGTSPATNVGGYKIHTFTSSGTFTVISGGEVEYLVVAGGGGGGSGVAGGGGAGGMLTGSVTLATNTYNITVGGGGTGGIVFNTYRGTSGYDSSISNLIVAAGGGAGASAQSGGPGLGALSGGSGGGGSYYSDSPNIRLGNSGISGQGNDGGDAPGVNNGGGGGGAGSAGSNAGSSSGGNGGIGLQSRISGTNTYYAGGGGGGSNSTAGNGGTGGGGNGGLGANYATTGTDGLGGGGGGAWNYTAGNGGSGGDGIVIIRYLL